MKNINAKVLASLFAAVAITGCSNSSRVYPTLMEDGSQGRFNLSGDVAGIKAWGDYQNAIITNTKTTDPKGDSAAWSTRVEQERNETLRNVAKSNNGNPDVVKLLKDFLFPKSNPSQSNGIVPTLPEDQTTPVTHK